MLKNHRTAKIYTYGSQPLVFDLKRGILNLKVSLTRAYGLFMCFVILQTQDFTDWEVGQLPWRKDWCQRQRWELTWLSWLRWLNEGNNWLEVKTLHHSWTDKLVTITNCSRNLIYWMKKRCNLSSYLYTDSCQSTNKKAARQTNTEFIKLRCRWTESSKNLNGAPLLSGQKISGLFYEGLTDKCGNHFLFAFSSEWLVPWLTLWV